MIKIFQYLFTGCWHDWKATGSINEHYDGSFGGRDYMYTAHQMKCTKCGRFTVFKDKSGG